MDGSSQSAPSRADGGQLVLCPSCHTETPGSCQDSPCPLELAWRCLRFDCPHFSNAASNLSSYLLLKCISFVRRVALFPTRSSRVPWHTSYLSSTGEHHTTTVYCVDAARDLKSFALHSTAQHKKGSLALVETAGAHSCISMMRQCSRVMFLLARIAIAVYLVF